MSTNDTSPTHPQLEIVRESFKGGLTLTFGELRQGKCDLYLAIREKIAIQADEDGHTSVLRAPAWGARLENIEASVVGQFVANRSRHGGFMLLIRAVDWEFLTSDGDSADRVIVWAVEPHR